MIVAGHWKDKWKDGGDGQYNCTFPDGLTDHGRLIQLFTDAVRYSRNTTFTTWLSCLISQTEGAGAFYNTGDLIEGSGDHDHGENLEYYRLVVK